jgi:hypothetical protein
MVVLGEYHGFTANCILVVAEGGQGLSAVSDLVELAESFQE